MFMHSRNGDKGPLESRSQVQLARGTPTTTSAFHKQNTLLGRGNNVRDCRLFHSKTQRTVVLASVTFACVHPLQLAAQSAHQARPVSKARKALFSAPLTLLNSCFPLHYSSHTVHLGFANLHPPPEHQQHQQNLPRTPPICAPQPPWTQSAVRHLSLT